jgi:hypothetical protein
MNWKPGILAAAAFTALATPCAAADFTCSITDQQGNQLIYEFDYPTATDRQGRTDLDSAMIEVGFTKNHSEAIVHEVGHRPVWTYVIADGKGGSPTLWSRMDKGWAITFELLRRGIFKAALWHNDYAVGSGSCVLIEPPARPIQQAPPIQQASPAPQQPYAVMPPANCVDRSAPQCNQTPAPQPSVSASSGDSVALTSDDGGRSLYLFADLGTGPYRFLLDTGATDLVVTEGVANDLLKNGMATEGPPAEVRLADGSVHEQNTGGSMLIGMSVLNRIGKITIDAVNRKLIFNAD